MKGNLQDMSIDELVYRAQKLGQEIDALHAQSKAIDVELAKRMGTAYDHAAGRTHLPEQREQITRPRKSDQTEE